MTKLPKQDASQFPRKGAERQYPLEPSPARVSAGNTAPAFLETDTGPWLCYLVSPTAGVDVGGDELLAMREAVRVAQALLALQAGVVLRR